MKKSFGILFAMCIGAVGVLRLNAAAEERWPVPDHYFGPDTVMFAPFGPTVTGAATYEFTLGTLVKDVTVDASGYSSVQ